MHCKASQVTLSLLAGLILLTKTLSAGSLPVEPDKQPGWDHRTANSLKLVAYDYDKQGVRRRVQPGRTKIEVWRFTPRNRSNPYQMMAPVYTDPDGFFKLQKKHLQQRSLLLLSRTAGRSSAVVTVNPKRLQSRHYRFITEKYEQPRYKLIKTKYRGNRYYVKTGKGYYRLNGKITRRYSFMFPGLRQNNHTDPAVNRLLNELGGNSPADTDTKIINKVKKLFALLRSKGRRYMGKKDKSKRAALYMFRNCRRSPRAPLRRWPTLQEIAATYRKFGIIPLGNCTAKAQIAATLLYAAGVPANRIAVSKYHYNMSWIVEHWVLALHLDSRWFALDPGFYNLKIKSLRTFQNGITEKYISGQHDYTKPFELYLLPGSNLDRVPFMGDPENLQSLNTAESGSAAKQKNINFFRHGLKYKLTGGSSSYRYSGYAVVNSMKKNTVKLSATVKAKNSSRKIRYSITLTCKNGKWTGGTHIKHSGKLDTAGKTLKLTNGSRYIILKRKYSG